MAVGHGCGEHGAHAELPQGADDAHGDLAAVGHEDGLEHGGIVGAGSPPTCGPLSTGLTRKGHRLQVPQVGE